MNLSDVIKDREMIDFNKGNGLVPAIVQDANTGEVLMLAYMNRESWEKTVKTGKATYFSRSRKKLWVKGESSGHVQEVTQIFMDCDADTVLLKVIQHGGAACHTGYRSCFFKQFDQGRWQEVGERVFDPKEVYRR